MTNRGGTRSAGKPAGRVKGAGGAMPVEMPEDRENQLDADAVGGRAGEPNAGEDTGGKGSSG